MLKLDAKALAAAGRNIPVPFDLALPDGRVLTVEHLLRVLPGKRVVGRARLEARVVLVKFFVAARSEQHWQRELAGLRALDAAGLPTPGLLEAMPLKEGGHVLLTRFLPDAESLASLWQSDADDAQRVQRLFPVMSLLAQMHATGLAQADLHLGNFLVTQGRYYVIDGDAVTHAESKGGLSVDARLDNLAILFAQLPPSWDGQISPVLQHYSAAADGMQFDAAALQERIIAVRQRRLKEFLGKLGRDCTQFAVDRDFSRFSVVDRNTLDSLREVLADPDLALENGRRLKSGGTCTVADVSSGGQRVVIKRYNLKHWRHALSRMWRPSRAWHAWREGHRLAFYDIATPRPLAMIEERWGVLRRRAFLVTEFCAGRSLLDLLDAQQVPDGQMAKAIVDVFRALCDLRITHGDLKASNLLWADGRVVLIDLDATQQHTTEQGFQRAWRRDRARLLRNWPADVPLVRWLDAVLPQIKPH